MSSLLQGDILQDTIINRAGVHFTPCRSRVHGVWLSELMKCCLHYASGLKETQNVLNSLSRGSQSS